MYIVKKKVRIEPDKVLYPGDKCIDKVVEELNLYNFVEKLVKRTVKEDVKE